ncbi:antitoxin [Mycolicibacterium arenosum]|uniref:Antitoxin n=1 Tax=Mycolicibacterium arenosum TaxID=2952157 RepID=A0ABT1LXL4_9MYCO|nr:antitoxin [Mycolicibacterium sp. CAU 1645]MCP9271644.1 antitoxin [Mycolicibacterium sp. CAU 1645]
MGFLDTVKNLVSKNADKVDTAIDKVGDAVDKKTGNKYKSVVDKAQDAAKKAVDKQVPPTQQSGQTPPANDPPTAPPIS